MFKSRFKPILNTIKENRILKINFSIKSDLEKSSSSNLPSFSTSEKADISRNIEEVKQKLALTKNTTKKDLDIQKPWQEKERVVYFTFLRAFYSESNNTEVLKFLQTPIDLSPSAIKKWWKRKLLEKEIITQGYIPERIEILGAELAAAHFIVFRGGAVKFFDEDKWIKADEFGNFSLPPKYVENKILQGIDCSNVNIHYEGLVNFRNLQKVEWLSFNNCKYINDWCIDTISNIFSENLIYLDLRNCQNVTYRGIGALYKIKSLKILYLDKMYKGQEYELTCLLLQELLPDLDIRLEN